MVNTFLKRFKLAKKKMRKIRIEFNILINLRQKKTEFQTCKLKKSFQKSSNQHKKRVIKHQNCIDFNSSEPFEDIST